MSSTSTTPNSSAYDAFMASLPYLWKTFDSTTRSGCTLPQENEQLGFRKQSLSSLRTLLDRRIKELVDAHRRNNWEAAASAAKGIKGNLATLRDLVLEGVGAPRQKDSRDYLTRLFSSLMASVASLETEYRNLSGPNRQIF